MKNSLIILMLLVHSTLCFAHKPSDSYLSIINSNDVITATWAISLRDLEYAVGLDINQDSLITWGELQQRQARLENYVLSHLSFTDASNQSCHFISNELLVDSKTDGSYAVLKLTTPCITESLKLEYNLFFDIDPGHRGLVSYTHNGNTISRIASPESSDFTLSAHIHNLFDILYDYIIEGIWHIWVGLDHILFLLMLLLPATLVRNKKVWCSISNSTSTTTDIIKIVTAFTIAHSLTLSLSIFEIVFLPTVVVETAIAVSVLLTALNNLKTMLQNFRWILAFGFGLIHGFGFANVLLDLGLPTATLSTALLGFNLGVELGQLAIVAAFLCVTLFMRHTLFYRNIIIRGGSVVTAVIAVSWIFERMFNYELPGL